MKFPIQPIKNKRFVPNKIVDHLLETSSLNMNDIAAMEFSKEDRMQFAMLIGYSLGGFSDLSYVDDETYYAAEKLSEAPQMTSKQQALEELKAWCEKFNIEIASTSGDIVIQIGDQTLLHTGCIVMDSDIQTELNRMKDDA